MKANIPQCLKKEIKELLDKYFAPNIDGEDYVLEKAVVLAAIVHRFQEDKTGKPYIAHCIRVGSVCSDVPALQAAGVLHDVIEDSTLEHEDLLYFGFPSFVCDTVQTLSKADDTTLKDYWRYIEEINSCPASKIVKIADLEHNLDITRLEEVTEDDIERINKYRKALVYLKTGRIP